MPLVTVPLVLSSLLAAVHTGLVPELLRRISPLLAGTRYTMEGGRGGEGRGGERGDGRGGRGGEGRGERGEAEWEFAIPYKQCMSRTICHPPSLGYYLQQSVMQRVYC